MKLSKDQITSLKKLISYKGYPEIDLQYEILDHVACKVEVLLEKNPSLSLDDAFRKVHGELEYLDFWVWQSPTPIASKDVIGDFSGRNLKHFSRATELSTQLL